MKQLTFPQYSKHPICFNTKSYNKIDPEDFVRKTKSAPRLALFNPAAKIQYQNVPSHDYKAKHGSGRDEGIL